MPKRLTDLRGKCGSCLWYEPLIKNGKRPPEGRVRRAGGQCIGSSHSGMQTVKMLEV